MVGCLLYFQKSIVASFWLPKSLVWEWGTEELPFCPVGGMNGEAENRRNAPKLLSVSVPAHPQEFPPYRSRSSTCWTQKDTDDTTMEKCRLMGTKGHCQALLRITTWGFPAWENRSKTDSHVSMRGSLALSLSTCDKALSRAEEHISWVEMRL